MGAIEVASNGGPEELVWGQTGRPDPGPGQALVRVAAAGVNFIDVYQRQGLYPLELPFTPGQEGAGTVEEVGEPGSDVSIGDRVAWADVIGSYAEHLVAPGDRLVKVPEEIELEIAAAVLLQGATAHYLVHDTYSLSEGERCLVHAGAGGVGRLLIQLAKMRGAFVITTVSTAEKAELAESAGADHVINYAEVDFREAVEGLLGPKALDVVYDGVGAATLERGLELLRPRGMMVAFGNASGRPPKIDPLLLSRLGSLYLTRPTLFNYVPTAQELRRRAADLFGWIADGRLEVLIGSRYPIQQAGEAHRALEGRRTVGKVLLVPSQGEADTEE